MNPSLLNLCRDKLVKVAKARTVITYGKLAAHVKVANQSLGPYLMKLYEEDKSADLTLVVVYTGTDYGRIGEDCKRPQTDAERERYDHEREKVYQKWANGGDGSGGSE
jgi:hypothetical protein